MSELSKFEKLVFRVFRVGEFKKVSWCKTHDEPILMQFGGSLHETDDECEVVGVWLRFVEEGET